MRRAPLRQKAAVLAPRSIPDDLVDELMGALPTSVWVFPRGLEPVPPESLRQLAAYFHEYDTPGPDELIWRALH
ncbi:cytosine/adenosine deaminase-related metal-dependent hydrolase [Arthrobacter sp. V1I7]|nr:cytosine/adenosine deaminase-related metal-dependent hydrolase [Arthrobacter sp. V1I7]